MTEPTTRPQAEQSTLTIPERLLTDLLQGPKSDGAESDGPEAVSAHTSVASEPGLPVRYRRGTPLYWEPTPRTAPSGSDGQG